MWTLTRRTSGGAPRPWLRTGLAALLLGAAAAPGAAQVREPAVADYEFVSDVRYAPAMWVNPGALAIEPDLNVIGHVSWGRPEGTDWSTRQYLVGFHTKVLGLGYRHDEFAPPRVAAQGDAYTVALGYASEGTGLGVSRTWHRGGRPREGSWDIGLAYRAEGPITIGLVWRDIGSPEVRGAVRPERLIGGFTLRAAAAMLALSAQVDYRTDAGDFGGFRVGGDFRLGGALEALVRADWNGDGDFGGLWLGARLPLGRILATGVAGLDSDLDARIAHLGGQLIERRPAVYPHRPSARAR